MPARLCRKVVTLKEESVRVAPVRAAAAASSRRAQPPRLFSITSEERAEVLRLCRVD